MPSELAEADHNETKERVKIWDFPVRIFHLTLILLLGFMLYSGFFFLSGNRVYHIYAGYGFTILIGFRFVWGFWGTAYSRFSSWRLSLVDSLNHLITVTKRKAPFYAGHTPPGTWMIVVMLILFLCQIITGLILVAGTEASGPLVHWFGYFTSRPFVSIHNIISWLILGCIVIHILAVLWESFIIKHPLISAMFTGHKPILGGDELARPMSEFFIKRAQLTYTKLTALLFFLGVIGTCGLAYAFLSNLSSIGRYVIDKDSHDYHLYKAACGSCHTAYHPSMRSAADWRSIFAKLNYHYANPVTLEKGEADKILVWLVANDGSHFDTRISNYYGKGDGTGDGRFTSSKRWNRVHSTVPKFVFRNRMVKMKQNCSACHQDAEDGLFNSAAIKVPVDY